MHLRILHADQSLLLPADQAAGYRGLYSSRYLHLISLVNIVKVCGTYCC